MARILIHVEGETEETFVNEVLGRQLLLVGHQVSARLLGNSRIRARRGGIKGWDSTSVDIVRHLKGDSGCFATLMVDYYALPQTGSGAWPGRSAAAQLEFERKAPMMQEALLADISKRMGEGFDPARFIPFVTMHEFEGLLFSDCAAFASGIGRDELAGDFRNIRAAFGTPEEINDSPLTAPSKRVEQLVPEYTKPLMGSLAALEIGLSSIRAECPLFDAWVTRLEVLPR
jgi:hypothetical protein